MIKLSILMYIVLTQILYSGWIYHTKKPPDSIIDKNRESKVQENLTFVEIGGNGIIASFNYERLIYYKGHRRWSIRLGFLPIPQHEFRGVQFSRLIESKTFIGKKNSYFVLGFGVSFFGPQKPDLIFCSMRIGYRYQNPNRKLFFNAAFVPQYNLYDSSWDDMVESYKEAGQTYKPIRIFPWLGISLGFFF